MLFTFQIRAAYDDGGLVFGIMSYNLSTSTHSIRLYDPRMYEKGPFQEICPNSQLIEKGFQRRRGLRTPLSSSAHAVWTDFEFSSDGLHILVNTVNTQVAEGGTTSAVLLLDGFNADVEPAVLYRSQNAIGDTRMHVEEGHKEVKDPTAPLGACFSMDGR